MAAVPGVTHASSEYCSLLYTFGVELELIIKFRFANYGIVPDEKHEYSFYEVHEHVVEVLRKDGLQVNDYHGDFEDLSFWSVKFDDSVCESHVSDKFGYAPTEITTPVLRFARSSTFDSFQEIQRMLMALGSSFHAYINQTCGLHVHVGAITNHLTEDYRYSRGFPMRTLRNFCQLVTLCEPELNAIHPPARYKNGYSALPSQLSQYQTNAAAVIDKCKDFTDIHWIWMGNSLEDPDNPPKPCPYIQEGWSIPAYYLGYLTLEEDFCPTDRSRRTIEFRQHVGTLKIDEIYHWVKTVVRIVQFCNECGPNGLPQWLISAVNSERLASIGMFHTGAFLEAIGAGEQATYYESRGLYQYSPPENPQLDTRPPKTTQGRKYYDNPFLFATLAKTNAWPEMERWPDGPCAENGCDEDPIPGSKNYRDLTNRPVEY